MSSKPPSPVKPYTVYRSTPSILVEKNGTKGGDRTKPKAYSGHVVRETKVSGNYNQPQCYNNWDTLIDKYGPWARSEAKLYAKIQELLGERAEIGTTLAEYHSGIQMVTSGATRLAQAALALKKGRFHQFLEHLNAKPLAKHRSWLRSPPKIASQLWIEYWFGWAPTINDIQTAAKILDSTPPVGNIPFSVATGASWILYRKANPSEPMVDVGCMSYSKAGGEYRLVNPNLALAQRMGILNPLTIAVNVTPWSWLLGWFVNLNQWVDSLTGFAGYEFTNCYVTRYTVFEGIKRWQFSSSYAQYGVQGMYIKRSLRLPQVRLHQKNFNLSLTRAATAVSLLTMRLKSL